MNDQEFDALINKIQNEVFTEAKNALGEKGFDRWRNPKYFGVMEDADSHARMKGSCGDTMEMYISVNDDRIDRSVMLLMDAAPVPLPVLLPRNWQWEKLLRRCWT